jgi:tRNA-specific 2-thiouridylase
MNHSPINPINPTSNQPLKVICGMSGGVDSSVSALLLKEQGFNVHGLFMKNWEEENLDEQFCPAAKDALDAKAVADKIGISLELVNFSKDYWDKVFSYFLQEYQWGRTPNPDILCNKEIKFTAFLDYALAQGADFIATGHYARVEHTSEQTFLLKGKDPLKDQSYFLCALNQSQLKKVLFPVGELEKPAVREIAKKARFITHNKKDSTGICFIGERRFKNFLQTYLPAQPGKIHDEFGNMIGTHDGLMYHTLGQRQGLHIGGLKNKPELPWYVAKKDLKNNILIAVQGHTHPLLYSKNLKANQPNWISGKPPTTDINFKFKAWAKTRYRQEDQLCEITLTPTGFSAEFEKPQFAITPGQSAVLYDINHPEICIGSGVITE